MKLLYEDSLPKKLTLLYDPWIFYNQLPFSLSWYLVTGQVPQTESMPTKIQDQYLANEGKFVPLSS